MKRKMLLISVALASLIWTGGCGGGKYVFSEPTYTGQIEKGTVLREFSIDRKLGDKILALDPEHVSEKDIKEVLSLAPAPRIINLHGGIFPVHLAMKSFSVFLVRMGYPETKIRNPRDGAYSYSCYKSSEKIAGIIAWYYEKEGLRPMIIGHSQGGIQAVKVLHELSGSFEDKISVWNPITEESEDRYSIMDPLTGWEQNVIGLHVSYVTAVGAGGFTRFLPNQWSMLGKLRTIPDTVEEFTGFYMGFDLIGGDLIGFGPANEFKANGRAKVRNVKLPLGYNHVIIPITKHLVEEQEKRDWINSYVPTDNPELNVEFKTSSMNILWAADVWHSIKRHWVIELQRFIRAQRAGQHAP